MRISARIHPMVAGLAALMLAGCFDNSPAGSGPVNNGALDPATCNIVMSEAATPDETDTEQSLAEPSQLAACYKLYLPHPSATP